MNFKVLSLAGVSLCLMAPPAFAHHSFAMFDKDKLVTLQGTVSQFEWQNPHSFLDVMAMGQDGKPHVWSIELASIGQQTRVGWNANTVKPGDKITIAFNPLKDGTRGGTLVQVTLPDGRKLGHGGMKNNPLGKKK